MKTYQQHLADTQSHQKAFQSNRKPEERVIAPFEQVKILYDDKLIEKFNDETIWITVISDNPFVNAWYFNFNESGVVGGDHSF